MNTENTHRAPITRLQILALSIPEILTTVGIMVILWWLV